MSNTNESSEGQAMKAYTLGDVARKADTAALITNGTDAFPDDTFNGVYWTGSQWGGNDVAILEPVFKPGTLHAMTVQNNILSQCVEAMEVNIDGTGHSIVSDEEEGSTESDPEIEKEQEILKDFFHEPYPGKSMVEIRRFIRRDRETSGNGYMEVIRNVAGEVMLINNLDANDMRLVGYDDPVLVNRTIRRAGEDISVAVRARERRFVQQINGKKVFFKEFGASRELDRLTGKWAAANEVIPIERRASEVIHFVGKKEPKTAYGSPRWINQLPSILGSRKAEEFNLEYFDGGGIPPLLLMVMGGFLADTAKESLQAHFSAKGSKHRAAIVEVVSSSGSIDSAGTVNLRVERFGSERQSDAMFQNYDKNCEDHVRVSFRLPPLFLGKAADYTFATAYTAYMVAEAQVFCPERDDFDAKINNTIVKALGVTKCRFRSLPLTLTDVANQLKALGMVQDKAISGEDLVTKLNEITGLAMKYEKQEAPAPAIPANQSPDKATLPEPTPPLDPNAGPEGTAPSRTKKADDASIAQLAEKWVDLIGYHGPSTLGDGEKRELRMKVEKLPPEDYRRFNEAVAVVALSSAEIDVPGLGELCGCASHLVEA